MMHPHRNRTSAHGADSASPATGSGVQSQTMHAATSVRRTVRASRERTSHESSAANGAALGLRASEVSTMRPYQSLPTVEVARMMRESRAASVRYRGTELARVGALHERKAALLNAELLERAAEAIAACRDGIGVKHGAPEAWSDL